MVDAAIRTVPPSDRNGTYGGTFSIKCKAFPNFLICKILKIFM